ncbi:MAG: DUF2752 domain-containing protein [Actinomycetales bacterium]|nr:DUF2752 domain-containing protein [Actinomycetales bacterium]
MTTSMLERPGQPTAGRVARLRAPALVAASAAAGLAYIGSVSPYSAGGYPLCPVYTLTGLYCPGCGTARCLHSLVTGDVGGAFARNPLIPIVMVALAVAFVRWVVLRWRGERFTWNPPTWLPITLGAGVLLFGVLRNLPGLEFLAP